jgi:Kef-type K+ transport system membrane component KefB
MRRLCATVLVMETVVIWLAIPVAITIARTRPAPALAVGGALAVTSVVLAALVGRPRHRWALPAGSALQAVVIATGVVVPVMYALGVIFAGLWATAIWLARRHQVP